MEKEEKRYSILDELSNSSSYDIALMTTFNFEIGFFERAVLNRLYSKDVKTISLFVDAKELTKALDEFDIKHNGSHIGQKYMINPVKMDSSFHPKVILLLGEKKAKLFIGSANIKTSGYTTNNEVFNFITYDFNHPEFLDVIVSAIDFFCDINEISYKLDNQVLKAAKEYIYYHKTEKNNELFFIHNLKKSMLEQLDTIIQSEVKSISIAVPYYDNELRGLQEIKNRYPKAALELFIQNKFSTFPIEYNENNPVVGKINTFCGFKDTSSSTSGNFFHGKVFLLKTENKAYVLYGSANCTMSAMTKSFSDGGNVECDFLEVGGLSEFDYFFDNMILKNDEEFTSQKLVYDTPKVKNFSFKYGEIKERTVELHIGYLKKIDNLVIELRENELDYEFKEDELRVFINEECCDFITDIFDIAISFENEIEVIRCWTYNPVALANNRKKQNYHDNLNDFEIEATGDKYLEYRIKFLKAEATSLNEILEYKNNLKYMNQIKMEQENESYDPEGFVVDYQIPDEYRIAYRQYSAVSKIRNMLIRRFIGLSAIDELTKSEDVNKREVNKSSRSQVNPVNRKATSEEKKFEYFIKGKVKGMLNEVYVKVIELEHYVGIVQVLLEIFDRFRKQDPVEDIFTQDYVFFTKIQFLQRIIGKISSGDSISEELQNAIIRECFATIYENYLFYRELVDQEERWKYESLNRNLLISLEKQFNLRHNYKLYITDVINRDNFIKEKEGENKVFSYIEKLYGYKTYDMLEEIIREAYPDADIQINNSIMSISIKTNDFANYMKPNSKVLRDIADYSSNVSRINMVNIRIENEKMKTGNPLYVAENIHIVNLPYHQWKFKQKTVGGQIIESKIQNISF